MASGTSSPDQMIPSHSNMAAGELGLPFVEVLSTAGVCASGMTAMKYGYMNVALGLTSNYVTTGSERASAYMNSHAYTSMTSEYTPEGGASAPMVSFEKEFLRWMLSDGAGAVMLEPQPRADRLNLRIDGLDVRCASGYTPVCMYHGLNKDKDGQFKMWTDEVEPLEAVRKGYMLLQQDVRALEQYMVKVAVQGLQSSQQMWGFQWEEIDWFLPHLSSMYFKGRMFQGMQEAGINVPEEKWFTNLTYKGNVGSASIYVIMDEILHSGRLKKGDKIYCAVPESGRFTVAGMLCTVV
jgi:3-oxoacyl-[acyl-carrier-protein] synthase-3